MKIIARIVIIVCSSIGLFISQLLQAQSVADVQQRIATMTKTAQYYTAHPDSMCTLKYYLFLEKSKNNVRDVSLYLDQLERIQSKAEAYREYGISALLAEEDVAMLRHQSTVITNIQLFRAQFTMLREQHANMWQRNPAQMKRARQQYYSYLRANDLVVPERVLLNTWMFVPTTALSIGLPIFFHNNKTTLENNPQDPWVFHHAYWGLVLWKLAIWQSNWHTADYRDNVGFRIVSTASVFILADDLHQHREQLSDGYPETPGSTMYQSPMRRFVYDWWLDSDRDIEPWQLTLVEFTLLPRLAGVDDWLAINFGHYQGPFMGVSYKLAEVIGLGSLPINTEIIFNGRAIAGWDKSVQVRKIVVGPTLRVDIPYISFVQLEFGALYRWYVQEIVVTHTEQTQDWIPVFGLLIGSLR